MRNLLESSNIHYNIFEGKLNMVPLRTYGLDFTHQESRYFPPTLEIYEADLSTHKPALGRRTASQYVVDRHSRLLCNRAHRSSSLTSKLAIEIENDQTLDS